MSIHDNFETDLLNNFSSSIHHKSLLHVYYSLFIGYILRKCLHEKVELKKGKPEMENLYNKSFETMMAGNCKDFPSLNNLLLDALDRYIALRWGAHSNEYKIALRNIPLAREIFSAIENLSLKERIAIRVDFIYCTGYICIKDMYDFYHLEAANVVLKIMALFHENKSPAGAFFFAINTTKAALRTNRATS